MKALSEYSTWWKMKCPECGRYNWLENPVRADPYVVRCWSCTKTFTMFEDVFGLHDIDEDPWVGLSGPDDSEAP